MINSLRCLEEENKQLKQKLCYDKVTTNPSVTFQPALKNSFDVLSEESRGIFQEDNDFITVKSKKKRNKKKGNSNINKDKISFKNTNKTANKSKNSLPIPFKNVTVIGDSHVRNLAALLRNETVAGPVISGICKPGAGVFRVKPSVKPPSDHCYVLMAGTNDVDVGREDIIYGQLEEVLQTCKSSSHVLVISLTKRHDLPPNSPVHTTVRMVNNFISELCNRHPGVELLDVSSIARRHFTTHGLHMRHSGKRLLARLIVERIAHMKPQTPPQPQPPSVVATPTATSPLRPVTLQYDTYAEAVIKSTNTITSSDKQQLQSNSHLIKRDQRVGRNSLPVTESSRASSPVSCRPLDTGASFDYRTTRCEAEAGTYGLSAQPSIGQRTGSNVFPSYSVFLGTPLSSDGPN